MKYLNNSLFHAAGTYGFFYFLNSSIPFLLLPVMTRYLSPEDYGLVSVFSIIISLIIPFIGMNIQTAFSKVYFAPERFDSSSFFGTAFLFISGMGILATVLFYIFGDFLSGVFVFPANWIWTIPFAAMALVFVQMVQLIWQVREKPFSYGVFQCGRSFSEAMTSILFVVIFGMTWQGSLLAKIITLVGFAIGGLFLLAARGWISFKFNRDYLFYGLSFGIPIIPHSVGGLLNSTIDRIFISKMVGVADVGLYTVGYQIGAIISLLAISFNQAYVPWLFRKLNQNQYEEKCKIVKLTYLYFALILGIATCLGIIAPYLLKWFVGVNFEGASVYVIWIALGYAFDGMYYMVVNYIFYQEKTYLLSIVTFLSASINVGLSYYFISYNGSIGAAQATSLTRFLSFIAVWFLSIRLFPMPWWTAFKQK